MQIFLHRSVTGGKNKSGNSNDEIRHQRLAGSNFGWNSEEMNGGNWESGHWLNPPTVYMITEQIDKKEKASCS